ncbi:MAG: nucleoside deaminase [Ignavibacteriae bacterium]|nr:MAG: nucleoside deaminase [Ignavibacteriota bacterium]
MKEFMEAAIDEARLGLQEGGIPIGSVLVRDGKIIGRGHNRRIQNGDPLAHAEIECMRNAGRIGSYANTILFSTLIPCYLCSGAIVQFGIEKVIVGESRTFKGDIEFLKDHWVDVEDWDMKECVELMTEFIKNNPTLWNEDIGKL